MDLRPARPDDEAAIAALLGAVFGGPDEARLVERPRASGDPGYYGRFGFSVAAARGLATPYPPEITGLLLLGTERPGGGAERVYPAAFAVL